MMSGRTCIRSTRITDALVVSLVANGMSTQEIIRENPRLESEDVRQSLQYAPRSRTRKWFCSRALPLGVLSGDARVADDSGSSARGQPGLLSIFATNGLYAFRPDIVAKALAESQVVLTFDLDFGDIRAAARRSLRKTQGLTLCFQGCEKELAGGALVMVEDERSRVRRRP